MPDNDQLYDIFIIYHPSDLRFVRRVDAHMKAHGMSCWVAWDDLGASLDGQTVLKSGILRSHTVAIALSPQSAENAICNMLIQHAINNSKRFVTLIVDEHIEVDVHPAIAENPYIFFRDQDVMEDGINELLDFMVVDDHMYLHTELLVYANDWDARDRNRGLLLPLDRVNEAREWLADGANRDPRPSQLQVEYIHASRRQKSSRRTGLGIYVVMGIAILGLLFAVVTLFQSAQSSQSVADRRSTEVAVQLATSDANAQLAQAVVQTATAEAIVVEDFAQTATSALALADMAVNSASTADVMQQTAQVDAQNAVGQAGIALTAQAEAEAELIIVSTESENSSTLSAQVLTAEFEAERLIETAQSAQNASLMMAQTATAVQNAANIQANIAATDVAKLATVIYEATNQLATTTAVLSERDNNASTAVAAEQLFATEAESRSTAEAELEAINDSATQTFETAQEVNSQALLFSAEQALNAGEVDLALALGLIAGDFVDDSSDVYRVLSRASRLSPSLIMQDISRVVMHPTEAEFAVIPSTFDSIQIYDATTRTVKLELTGHTDDITTLRYSLDGQFLVTASQDGTVIIWSTTTGDMIHELTRHQGLVNAIAMHPDGQRMVTAGIRPMLVLWDMNTGEAQAEFFADFGEEMLPNDLLVSADGLRIIGWSNPRGETLMSQWTTESLNLLTDDSGGQVYVGYSDNGDLAWTGGRALPAYPNDPNMGDLVLWQTGTGQQQTRLTDGFNWTVLSGVTIADATDSLQFMSFRDETALLGVQSSDGGQRVVLVNTVDGTIQRVYQSEITAQITSTDFVDETQILSTTRDNRLVVWSLEDGALLREVGISTRVLQEVYISGDWAIVRASGGETYLWNINGSPATQAQIITGAITGTALNQTGDRLLQVAENSISLLNTQSQQAIVTIDDIMLAHMNATGTHFATASSEGITLYDARTGIEQQRWSIAQDDIETLYMASVGSPIVVAPASGDLTLFREDTDRGIPLTPDDVSSAFGLRFSTDGNRLVTLHAESAILWDIATASELQRFPLGLSPDLALDERVKVVFSDTRERLMFFVQLDDGIAGLTDFNLSTGSVNRLTFVDVVRADFTDDGAHLLIASTDNSIQIINTATGEMQRRLVGHTEAINALFYQANNALLLSASDDNTLIIWDVDNGSIVQQYRHPANVLGLSVSNDGETVLTQSADGIYRLWQRERLADLIDRINATMSVRDLTCAEREQYNVLPLCS